MFSFSYLKLTNSGYHYKSTSFVVLAKGKTHYSFTVEILGKTSVLLPLFTSYVDLTVSTRLTLQWVKHVCVFCARAIMFMSCARLACDCCSSFAFERLLCIFKGRNDCFFSIGFQELYRCLDFWGHASRSKMSLT